MNNQNLTWFLKRISPGIELYPVKFVELLQNRFWMLINNRNANHSISKWIVKITFSSKKYFRMIPYIINFVNRCSRCYIYSWKFNFDSYLKCTKEVFRIKGTYWSVVVSALLNHVIQLKSPIHIRQDALMLRDGKASHILSGRRKLSKSKECH